MNILDKPSFHFKANLCCAAWGFGIGGVNTIFATVNLVIAVWMLWDWYEEENEE